MTEVIEILKDKLYWIDLVRQIDQRAIDEGRNKFHPQLTTAIVEANRQVSDLKEAITLLSNLSQTK